MTADGKAAGASASGPAAGTDWIAVDWGTSRLRAWAVDAGGTVRAEAASDAGMGGLEPDGFEPALLDLVAPWLSEGARTPVLACGMVGARQGWTEAPYRAVPCAPLPVPPGDAPVEAPVRDARLAVRILPGLSQARPADVMRGEETQIAGLLARQPGFEGVICLPGTHTKWARISAGEVAAFQTAMTGDLFGVLSERSVLRHSVRTDDWSAEAFAAAVDDALAQPERLATRLFAIRAEQLLDGLDPGAARARLSGLLIGAELAATRAYWLGERIALVGARGICETYAAALARVGQAPEHLDGAVATLAGLAKAREALTEAHP